MQPTASMDVNNVIRALPFADPLDAAICGSGSATASHLVLRVYGDVFSFSIFFGFC